MDREGVAVLSRPLVRVDDLYTDPVLLQEQGRDETDRTGADDENLRIAVTKHERTPVRATQELRSRGRSTRRLGAWLLGLSPLRARATSVPSGFQRMLRQIQRTAKPTCEISAEGVSYFVQGFDVARAARLLAHGPAGTTARCGRVTLPAPAQS
jgi:hypothetical protein